MADKRPNADIPESITPAKITKTPQSEFNGTVFKSMLKDPSKAFKGLEIFIRTAKNLPCASQYDVVEGYIKISAECCEILSLLEGDSHSVNELTLIFQSLELILLRTASDLSYFNMVGSTIVKKMISTHLKLLQSCLSSVSHQIIRQCLCLLAAMVSQGSESAREIFSSLVFSKAFFSLTRLRDKTGRPDVRTAYIKFVLSFMMCGDGSMVGHILDTKEFLLEILNTGLKEDRFSIVSLILSTLQTKVVHNTAISKSQKVCFFSASTLTQIASLYRWNGIMDTTTLYSQAVNKQEGGRLLVRELVHKFFLDLCCSHKHGICFHDPSLGTGVRVGNIVLLQFAVSLKQATEDELVAELLVSILKSSPDILSRFFRETQFSFTPRMKGSWLDSIGLLKKIYNELPEVSPALQLQETVPVSRLLSMVLVTTLPPVCNKTFFTQGLNLPSAVGQHATLSVLAFILRKAQKNMEYSLSSVCDSSDTHSKNAMGEFVQLYRETLSKILPDVISIVSLWQSLSKKEKEPHENTGATESKTEEIKTEEYDLVLFKTVLLQVLCLYQRIVPHLISQSRFDFSKLLKGIMSEKGMAKEVPPVLQHQILQLALELPASKFSWFRPQDEVDPGLVKGKCSVFHLLLKMFISSSSSHLMTSTRRLILKVMRDSGAFEHTWRELELWMDHLLSLRPSQQEKTILFLDQVLMRVVSNPYDYMDKVGAVVQEAVCLQAEMRPDREAALPISRVNDNLAVCTNLEGSGNDVEKVGSSLHDDKLQTFPFSAVVPAVLEARNKLLVNCGDENGDVCEYICAVLCDVLHYQRDPLTMCLTLQHYDKELLSSMNSRLPHSSIISFSLYYSKWLPQQPQETWCSWAHPHPTATTLDFTTLLKGCYIEGPEAFLRDSFRTALESALSNLQLTQFIGAVNQVLLYLQSFMDTFSMLPRGQAAMVVACILDVLDALLLNLHNTAKTLLDQTEPQEEDELSLVMNSTAVQQALDKQALLSVFRSVLKHPVLELWFLAVELDVMPSHSLEADEAKQLCAQMTKGVLTLLQSSTETLEALQDLELINTYLSATEKAFLNELQDHSRCPAEESQPVKAFLALYKYMEPSRMNKLLYTLLLLPKRCLLTEGKELSVYGHAALTVLAKSFTPSEKNNTPCLSSAHLHSLAALHITCHNGQLENILLQVLQRDHGKAKLIPTEVLLHCLQHYSNLDLAALLVQNCSTHCLAFELWCLEQSDLTYVAAQNNSFLLLLNSYLQTAVTEDPCRPKDFQRAVLQTFTKTLLPDLLSSALQVELGSSVEQRMEILSRLIQLKDVDWEPGQLIHDLPAHLQKPEHYERWQIVDSISEKLASSPEELHWRKSLLSAAFRWLSTTYKEQKKPQIEKEEAILKRLKTLLISPENVKALDWNTFVKCGLKYRYQDRGFLVTLNTLAELMYKSVNVSKDLMSIEILYMMVTSHSLFLSTMLSSQNEADFSDCKEALLSILITMIKKSPEMCSTSHLPVLLGAYGATLSRTDQKLLLLLKEYEKKNISLMELPCLIWGPAAMEYYKAQKQLGPSLWQQPSSEQLLAQLAADRMQRTVAFFPLHRHLVQQDGELNCIKERPDTPDELCLYDPCFLLPLFSFMLRPESVVDCRRFVLCHALGVTVVALSSHDHKMRAAAYHILVSFYDHLEGACFKEKKQLLYLLDTVRNGIQKQNPRISFVHTTYIAKVAQQILRPEEHMYLMVNRFLLGTQYVDLSRVPDFFKLFYSFDSEHKLEREWVLHVLEDGVKDGLCYDLCEQQGIYHTVLGFCSSSLCDQSFQIQILNVLRESVNIPNAAYDLTKAHGILSWILQLSEKSCVDGRMLNAVIGLLQALWFTYVGEKEREVQWSSTADHQQDGLAKCFPLPIISDFMCTLTSVIKHLRCGVEKNDMKCFLQTLASVLRNHKIACDSLEYAGCLTLHPYNLDCSSVLSLLNCWGTLTHDAALLHDLQDLANTYSIRGLSESGKKKTQGKTSLKIPQSSIKLSEVSDLEEYRPLLVKIFTHWELSPVLSSPNLKSGSVSDSSNRIYATAHTLIRWALKTLSERAYDDNGIFAILKWMLKVILPHKTVTESLLSDEAVRVDLLKLYHQTSKLETLELFTTIFIHFLDTERAPNVLHTSMIKACLAKPSGEGAEREAGLKLLSLYIYELFSGAKMPQLLMTHAHLLTRDRHKVQKKSTTPSEHICKDILSAMDSAVES